MSDFYIYNQQVVVDGFDQVMLILIQRFAW